MKFYHFHQFIRKYRYRCALCYSALYLFWFRLLEKTITDSSRYHIMHCRLDDMIPFLPVFVIPYLLWFLYVGGALIYLDRRDADESTRLGIFLAAGMTICLAICTLYPNGTDFRVSADPENGLLSLLTALIQLADTPTNVFPSIHVYNAVGVNAAIWRSRSFRDKPRCRLFSLLLMLAICCSTVFLKQHSLLDVAGAGILAYFMDLAVYGPPAETVFDVAASKEKIKEAA